MRKDIFVGRKSEIDYFKGFLKKKSASLIVVKGRRRIGKSRLIQEFSKGIRQLNFMGLPPDEAMTAQSQRDEFVRQLSTQIGIPGIVQLNDWGDIFSWLADQVKHGRVLISLDEISWMGSMDPTFLGKLKTVWDTKLKQNDQLILILCGSVSSWIEKNILASTGFYGRISWVLNLRELTLLDSCSLMQNKGFHGSPQEVFNILSVTGGIPWYLEQLQQNDSSTSFITRQCFTPGGVLVSDFERIFNDLFKQQNLIYQRIVEILVDGPLELQDIKHQLGYSRSGRLSQYISHLIDAGFISRHFAWSFKTQKQGNISQYRLSDNYLRFYLKYIQPRLTQIMERVTLTPNMSLKNLPGWNSIMGLQFENLVLNNRNLVLKALNILPENVMADNPYLQTATKHRRGCQVDYLIQTHLNVLYVCEIKMTQNEVTSKVIKEVQDKIKTLLIPRGYSCIPVLIHVGEVSDAVIGADYFKAVIDFRGYI